MALEPGPREWRLLWMIFKPQRFKNHGWDKHRKAKARNKDPACDVNQQNTTSQQEAMTHSISRTDHQHIPCDYSLLQENTRNLDVSSSPLAFSSLFAAICFPCCQCLQDVAGKQILVEEPEADLKFDSKGFSCPFHLTKCMFCYHPAQVVITEYLICLRLPVSKGTIR